MKKITFILAVTLLMQHASTSWAQKNSNTGSATTSINNVSAKTVIADYLKAIGGEEELKKIKTIWAVKQQVLGGTTITLITKEMAPNKSLLISHSNAADSGHNVKEVFNGNNGYVHYQGREFPIDEQQLSRIKMKTTLIPQWQYVSDSNIKMGNEGIEKINGRDAYAIQINWPNAISQTEYYDVERKLLVRKRDSTSNGVSITDYSDYRKVGKILFSYKWTLPNADVGGITAVTIVFDSIKLNEGVTEADFK